MLGPRCFGTAGDSAWEKGPAAASAQPLQRGSRLSPTANVTEVLGYRAEGGLATRRSCQPAEPGGTGAKPEWVMALSLCR